MIFILVALGMATGLGLILHAVCTATFLWVLMWFMVPDAPPASAEEALVLLGVLMATALAQTPAPRVTVQRGFYEQAFTVEVVSDAPVLHYTLDGSARWTCWAPTTAAASRSSAPRCSA